MAYCYSKYTKIIDRTEEKTELECSNIKKFESIIKYINKKKIG